MRSRSARHEVHQFLIYVTYLVLDPHTTEVWFQMVNMNFSSNIIQNVVYQKKILSALYETVLFICLHLHSCSTLKSNLLLLNKQLEIKWLWGDCSWDMCERIKIKKVFPRHTETECRWTWGDDLQNLASDNSINFSSIDITSVGIE
jgi:hypothetical protein